LKEKSFCSYIKKETRSGKKEIENISFSWRDRSGKRARIKTSTRRGGESKVP
jgi:hypothetical protein